MNVVIRKSNMSTLILLMLVSEVSSHVTERFMDDVNMTKRIQPRERTDLPWILSRRFMCGHTNLRQVYRRRDVGVSQTFMDDVSDVDTYFNEVPNPSRHMFEVQIPNTSADDVPNLDKYEDGVPNLDMYEDGVPNLDKYENGVPNLDKYEDGVPNLDKNSNAGPEILQHVSDESDLDKIIGGGYAVRGEIPWQVNVQWLGMGICGGIYISEFYILTSAHCLHNIDASHVTVVIGDYSRSRSDLGEQIFTANKLILHEQYRFSNSTHKPDTLKQAVMPLLSRNTCTTVYGAITPDMFCAGTVRGENEVCAGDSGGPLVYKHNGVSILYGIAESSHGCKPPNLPSLFTNVSMYLPWIQQKLEQHSNNLVEEAIPMRPRLPYFTFRP